MRQNTRVTFAMRDLDRLKCIQAVVDGDLQPIRAADRLGLTTRQVRRLARRYAAAGPVGLISKRFNRPSNDRLDDALADQVIKILRSTYADFGPTLATEKLRTKHGIDLAKETVRRLQKSVHSPTDAQGYPAPPIRQTQRQDRSWHCHLHARAWLRSRRIHAPELGHAGTKAPR